jgi:hypothetical protein
MRMLEVRGGLDLGEEAICAHNFGQLSLQHLERDRSLMLQVVREMVVAIPPSEVAELRDRSSSRSTSVGRPPP